MKLWPGLNLLFSTSGWRKIPQGNLEFRTKNIDFCLEFTIKYCLSWVYKKILFVSWFYTNYQLRYDSTKNTTLMWKISFMLFKLTVNNTTVEKIKMLRNPSSPPIFSLKKNWSIKNASFQKCMIFLICSMDGFTSRFGSDILWIQI